MRTASRSTRRTAAAQLSTDKENLINHSPASQRGSGGVPGTTTMSGSRKARHRVSTAELARLEDVFRQDTHPSRQQKKDLAAELGMDYKTVTIWFQNKRQTSKRGQPPVERLVRRLARTTRADSRLRSVSSPSHNATLDAFEPGVDPKPTLMPNPNAQALESKAQGQGPEEGLNAIASRAIVKIKPLLDSLNALRSKSRSREHSEGTEVKDEAPDGKGVDLHRPQTVSDNAVEVSGEVHRHDRMAEQEQTKGKSIRWKRIRTLEWACERQAKRRKLSREGFVRLGSEEPSDDDPSDTRMDSALSLLSLASSTQVGPPKEVMRGASLLLSFKHSWRRK